MSVTRTPFGSWTSPITSDLLVGDVVTLANPVVETGCAYWIENRPSEGGRSVLVRRSANGKVSDVFGPDFAARTLVHEYGGLCYAVHRDTVFFSNFSDQRVYRLDRDGVPVPITAEPPTPRAWRYADYRVTPDGKYLIGVRERHEETVVNELVALSTDGSGDSWVVATDHDFFSSPTLSPDGSRLSWIAWDHPYMPWDTTLLYEADLDGFALSDIHVVLANADESVIQPHYDAKGSLIFVSDRSGWWNLYQATAEGPKALYPCDGEFGQPAWVLGITNFVALRDGSLVVTWSEEGSSRLGVLSEKGMRDVAIEWPLVRTLATDGERVVASVASPVRAPAIVEVDLSSGATQIFKSGFENVVDPGYLSVPQFIEFPTEMGLSAFALYYPPTNQDFEGPEGEAPPLIVASHGGPTVGASSALSYNTQYWTSRGFAVVDVDYGGSVGYGRAYRERLQGAWGVVDLDDCVNAANYLVATQRANPHALLIHGGSAGGYTTLCALTFRSVFRAGASYFGVGDLSALAKDTHKFESRYLDGLVGPWPAAREIYEERSPIFHTDLLTTPMIIFQGLDDPIVPPNQAEKMVEALRQKGVPFAYLAYAGERHGLRQAKNITRAAEAELAFYGRVLGFAPADDIEPVEIENAAAL